MAQKTSIKKEPTSADYTNGNNARNTTTSTTTSRLDQVLSLAYQIARQRL